MVAAKGNYRMAQGCADLTEQLRMLDFAIQEVALYLDGYPDCREALCYYHKLTERRRAVAERVSAVCGPVTYLDNMSEDEWSWVKTPWPWEKQER